MKTLPIRSDFEFRLLGFRVFLGSRFWTATNASPIRRDLSMSKDMRDPWRVAGKRRVCSEHVPCKLLGLSTARSLEDILLSWSLVVTKKSKNILKLSGGQQSMQSN